MIHILGIGSIGKVVAHALAGLPSPPPMTLLLHRPTLFEEWSKSNRTVRLTTNNVDEERGGFNAELVLPPRTGAGNPVRSIPDLEKVHAKFNHAMSDEPIHSLIVAVKAPNTVSGLKAIKHRLTSNSTILFMQNGMGIIDEVNEKVFPDVEARPNYMLGINSHGAFNTGTFSANHAGMGAIYLGILPRSPVSSQPRSDTSSEGSIPTTARYLLRTLCRAPILGAVATPPNELFQAQLEKLVVNCIINPMTVMLDSKNGDLLYNHSLSRTMRLLLIEICLVIHNLPELQGVPNVKLRFSVDRMEGMVVNVAQKTAANISSMLADVRRGLKTEIDYINGYIIRRGEEAGIKPVMNYMLMQMVEGKGQMISREINGLAPYEQVKIEPKL